MSESDNDISPEVLFRAIASAHWVPEELEEKEDSGIAESVNTLRATEEVSG